MKNMNNTNLQNCIINVFKPEGISSQGVVTAVKRALGVKTAGHCGTLDPLATGVLPVMVGRAVKASEYLTDHDKRYLAKMKLGVVTDTGDITGNVLKTYDGKLPSFWDVLEVTQKFMGEIIQVPPMYSALKVDGKKLYDLARQGIEVERKGRKITIYCIAPQECGSEDEIMLDVLCSRGTYIRTLVEDIGNELGCGATMASLCRKSVGSMKRIGSKRYTFNPMFSDKNAVSFEDLKKGEIPPCAITRVEDVFLNFEKITFPDFYERLFSNGCEIYVSKLPLGHPAKNAKTGDVFRIYGKDGFFALGEAKEYDDGLAIKQIKRF